MSAPDATTECLDEDVVAAFVDGSLDRVTRARAELHIGACDECRVLVSELVKLAASAATPQLTPFAPTEPVQSDTDDTATPLVRGANLGRYVVLETVGRGGMGIVYAAYDPELDRKVAIKLLLREAPHTPGGSDGRELLLREAKAMAQLSHPNVVAVHDVGTHDDRVFLAMEFVDGGTIRSWLARSPRPSWQAIVATFVDAGRGLVAAHEAGLVHRDFKPDNVLVRRDGRVCVTDFGLARWHGAAASTTGKALDLTATATGALVGTPAYMAPEQLAGGAADPLTDQFAFAVALYEALYGERPFEGATLATLSRAVSRGTVRPPPDRSPIPKRIRQARTHPRRGHRPRRTHRRSDRAAERRSLFGRSSTS